MESYTQEHWVGCISSTEHCAFYIHLTALWNIFETFHLSGLAKALIQFGENNSTSTNNQEGRCIELWPEKTFDRDAPVEVK